MGFRRTTKRLSATAFDAAVELKASTEAKARLAALGWKVFRITDSPVNPGEVLLSVKGEDDWGLLYADGTLARANGRSKLTMRPSFLYTPEEIERRGLKEPSPAPAPVAPAADVELREEVIEALMKTGLTRAVAAERTKNPATLMKLARELEVRR